jgi:hypothetical protein
MMPTRAVLAFVLLVAAGCKKADGRAAAVDAGAARPAPLTCRALDGCTADCTTAACAEACVARLVPAARPIYAALQACVVPACANADAGAAPCATPGAFACKMCVLAHCASQAAACMKN